MCWAATRPALIKLSPFLFHRFIIPSITMCNRKKQTLAFSTFKKTPSSELENLLIVASISKTLIKSGTRNLDYDSTPLSESIVLLVLQRSSIHTFEKIDFFKWVSSGHNYKHSASTYSAMFHVICRSGCLQEISPLLELMRKDEVVIDSATFKLLLVSFISSGNLDSALKLISEVETIVTSLNPHMYNSVLIAFVRKKEATVALGMFKTLLSSPNSEAFVPDALLCNEMFVALRKSEMRVEFKEVFEILREKKGFKLDTWGYNVCIHAFGCWGDLSTSLKLFKEMKENDSGSSRPDLCTYNSLLRVLCAVGKVKDALIVWEELKGSGHDPDAISYRTIIQGCCKTYRIDDATRIFSEMKYYGFRPDTLVYNSVLDGLFKVRKTMEACQLFEKMVHDGVRASCWSYNILIDGLFRNGRAEAAYTLFCDLKKKGEFVDGVTYSIVILHLCKEGQLEGALEFVEEMEARGFVVDLVTITSLLIEIYKQHRWDQTERLLKVIRDSSILPEVLRWKDNMEVAMKGPHGRTKDFTPMFPSKGNLSEIMDFISPSPASKEEYSNLVAGEIESELTSCATYNWSPSPYMDKLVDQIGSYNSSLKFSRSRSHRVQEKGIRSFDINMVNTFLSIFLAKGNLSLACKLFEIFTEKGVNPVSYTYNSMMTSFIKKGYFNEAGGILHEMGEKLCPADIATYNILIQGLGKMGRADLACAVLDQLEKQGGYLDIVMYNTLINALGKAGRIEEVNQMFEQMRKSGIHPDIFTYNILIEVHSKASRVDEARKFFQMMLDNGCSPNRVTHTTLEFLGKEIERLKHQKASIKLNNKDNTT
ncbi:hypothetical protein MKW94_009420 [Papaver nudicaule]|uniref:Pentatricopeptide repeat-containing protein n=1 Tax=Papaver nudicaule TaxID=74823 RepID=A0AA41RQ50_PAPNU|nr:hypothetical protein [Papaver nudicaule]MCL7024652.1 hypothetical protein [Papaver nudicaule]